MIPTKKVKNLLFNVPNKITLSRISAIPLLLILYPFDVFGLRFVCALLFLAAALTDFFDGFFARKFDEVTSVGALLDPIADKMLIITGLILLVSGMVLYPLIAVLLICRDVAISGVRLIALEKKISINVNIFGKLKTTFQIIAIFSLIIDDTVLKIPFHTIGMICIWAALFLSYYSAYLYIKEFLSEVKNKG